MVSAGRRSSVDSQRCTAGGFAVLACKEAPAAAAAFCVSTAQPGSGSVYITLARICPRGNRQARARRAGCMHACEADAEAPLLEDCESSAWKVVHCAGASSAETVLLRRASSGLEDMPMACPAAGPAHPQPPPAAAPPATATPADSRGARPPPQLFVLACTMHSGGGLRLGRATQHPTAAKLLIDAEQLIGAACIITPIMPRSAVHAHMTGHSGAKDLLSSELVARRRLRVWLPRDGAPGGRGVAAGPAGGRLRLCALHHRGRRVLLRAAGRARREPAGPGAVPRSGLQAACACANSPHRHMAPSHISSYRGEMEAAMLCACGLFAAGAHISGPDDDGQPYVG